MLGSVRIAPQPVSQILARDAEGKVQRDALGLPIGGLLLPELAFPQPAVRKKRPKVFCALSGNSVDLTPAEMAARCGTPEAFAVGTAGQALVETG